MLTTRMVPSSPGLRPYVWAYGMTAGRTDSSSRAIPLPARPKQLLTFCLADRFRILGRTRADSVVAPRISVVGPQTCAQPGLLVSGVIDNFTIHFQPSGFHALFRVPMTELTDSACDAYAILRPQIADLEQQLSDAPGFRERIQIVEKHLIRLLPPPSAQNAVAMAANNLFARNGVGRVSAMASDAGLSPRQFERRFLAQVGVSPKLYARIIRFNAALDQKLQSPNNPWSFIANEYDFSDQMHLVHDCRVFTGQSPSVFFAHLKDLPAFHTFFATTAERSR